MAIFLACVPACLAGPSDALAETGSIRSLPVPTVTIYPGQVIEADHLTSRRFQTTPQSLSGIAVDGEQILGKETRRRLIAGRPISLAALTKPAAIKRGESGVAFYREDGFSISTPVIALEDGASGDVIDVRATANGSVIQVEVKSNGELAVLAE
ncbi:MAG: flagellar basal body P-ring formation chaperone FlgA [Aestuariivirga sp.]|uniref:flagellar basal body P-ring formation chaperone FlgA n=1 Tax=Aestuariivirga sp. TaxID=2650926 RepID=UPI0038D0D5D1